MKARSLFLFFFTFTFTVSSVFLFPLLALAGTLTPLFGPEFTFTNPEVLAAAEKAGGHVVNTPFNEAKRDQMKEEVLKKCPDCQVDTQKNKYGVIFHKITHPGGLWFQISTDPGVVEIQMKPLSLDEIKQNKELIQDLIFGGAKASGMAPHEVVGGGHIHMDLVTAFEGSAALFLNFFTDYQNHARLGHTILCSDPYNAPVVRLLKKNQRDNYEQIVEDYRIGRKDISQTNIAAIARRIIQKVYDKNFSGRLPPEKYQALNLTRIVDPETPTEERTIEVRAFNPQRSVDDYIKEAELLQARLNALQERPGIVSFMNGPIQYCLDFNLANAQRAVDQFHHYVTDSGLSWDDYRDFLPQDHRMIVPTELLGIQCRQP